MRASDFEIRNYNKLDSILVELCELVIAGQRRDPERYGMVGACVLDTYGNQTVGSSTNRNGKWVHAERVAIERYLDQHGEIPPGSIIVTTLSPCNETDDNTAERRAGDSCTDLINQSGIKEVYCGYRDPSQENNHNNYQEIFTKNSKIRNLSKQFADTFLPNYLHELSFLGSPCTKDFSGHRAGYRWSKDRGNIHAASWSRSFNNGAALAAAGR